MVFVMLGAFILGACSIRKAPEVLTASLGLEAQLEAYVRAQEALAADSFEDAKGAIESLVAVADTVTAPLARSVAGAGDIETMRARFKPLSEFLAALDLPKGFARAYCPMYDKGSNWVQRDSPIRNPYYGSAMLTCGVIDAAPGAHMDHTPRHGGQVFMAPDSFHHIEGTYPELGIFRVYATDNYREPVDVSGWVGRAVLEEEYDEATDEFIAVREVGLVSSPDGAFLEAAVGELQIPTEVSARVVFVDGFPAERFDFIFMDYSVKETVKVVAAAATSPKVEFVSSVPLAERIRPRIPERPSDIVAGIIKRDQEVQELINRGAFTEIFIPALQSKELALALNDRVDSLPLRARNDIQIAVRHLVRSAWLLDWYGDLGNKQQVSSAYDIFGSAVSTIAQVYDLTP